MPKLIFTPERAREIVYDEGDDFEDWKEVEHEEFKQGRWSIGHDLILKHIPTNKFYSTNYSVGATESQDEIAYEYEKEVAFTEMEPYEKVVKSYRVVKD